MRLALALALTAGLAAPPLRLTAEAGAVAHYRSQTRTRVASELVSATDPAGRPVPPGPALERLRTAFGRARAGEAGESTGTAIYRRAVLEVRPDGTRLVALEPLGFLAPGGTRSRSRLAYRPDGRASLVSYAAEVGASLPERVRAQLPAVLEQGARVSARLLQACFQAPPSGVEGPLELDPKDVDPSVKEPRGRLRVGSLRLTARPGGGWVCRYRLEPGRVDPQAATGGRTVVIETTQSFGPDGWLERSSSSTVSKDAATAEPFVLDGRTYTVRSAVVSRTDETVERRP